jgi:hypothetical protein
MEEEMRRVAMILGTVGLMALGIAATPAPAQAHDAGWGYPASREQAWRQHEWRQHEWRQHRYWQPWSYNQGYYAPRRHYAPDALGFNFR